MLRGDYLSLDEKVAAIEALGDESLIEVFKGWSPARYNYRKKNAPLDQRISVTVTEEDKASLIRDLSALKAQGEAISMSTFIRNRATGNVDLNEWRDRAEEALREISYLRSNFKELKREKISLEYALETESDPDILEEAEMRLDEIDSHLRTMKSEKVRRPIRLTGRTTFAEREIIVWRAQRLSLNISDYLRLVVFGHVPNSEADWHMPLEARQRFYVSILEVAKNGFGEPPSAATCSNCITYLEELAKVREELRTLRQYQ